MFITLDIPTVKITKILRITSRRIEVRTADGMRRSLPRSRYALLHIDEYEFPACSFSALLKGGVS